MKPTKSIVVAAAVITNGDRVLAAQRGPAMSLPGKWEFPGGKIEPGETGRTALTREIYEELSCTIDVGNEIVTASHDYEFGTVTLTTYYATIIDRFPVPSEHSEIRWCTCQELALLDWAPADIPTVNRVQRSLEAMRRQRLG